MATRGVGVTTRASAYRRRRFGLRQLAAALPCTVRCGALEAAEKRVAAGLPRHSHFVTIEVMAT